MSWLLYGINDYQVSLSKDDIEILQQKFLYHESWYCYDGKWIIMSPVHVKSMLKDFLQSIGIYVNTYLEHNYNILKQLLYKSIIFDPKHLLCFKNGTYDLTTHQFRKSCWNDYCTLWCDYNFEPVPMNKNDRQLVSVMYFIFIGKPLIIYDRHVNYSFFRFVDKLFGQYSKSTKLSYLTKPELNYRCIIDVYSIDDIDKVRMIAKTTTVIGVTSQKLQEGCLLETNQDISNINVLSFMNQLIALDQIPIQWITFKQQTILVNDIANYILLFLYDIMI